MTRLPILSLLACLAACRPAPERPPLRDVAPAVAAPSVVAPMRILLGQIPTTSTYRVIACSIGGAHADGDRQDVAFWTACDRALEERIGQEVDFGAGKRARLTNVVRAKNGAGEHVRAFAVDAPLGPVGVVATSVVEIDRAPKRVALAPAVMKALEARHRSLSPKAVWAIRSSFAADAIEANLDGDEKPDRFIVSELTQSNAAKESAVNRVVWVSLNDSPPEPVDVFPVERDVAALVDFDGDGRQEVLTTRRSEHASGRLAQIDYEYRLWHWIPGKPLAVPRNGVSEGWQVMAQLEDHDHSDE